MRNTQLSPQICYQELSVLTLYLLNTARNTETTLLDALYTDLLGLNANFCYTQCAELTQTVCSSWIRFEFLILILWLSYTSTPSSAHSASCTKNISFPQLHLPPKLPWCKTWPSLPFSWEALQCQFTTCLDQIWKGAVVMCTEGLRQNVLISVERFSSTSLDFWFPLFVGSTQAPQPMVHLPFSLV